MDRDRFKNHWDNNKKFYAGFAIGVAGILIVVNRSPQIINTVAPVFNNDNSSTVVNFGGYATKIVKCVETGEIWETVKDAASAANTEPAKMSRHLNGHMDHVDGLHFMIIGQGTRG